MISPLLDRLIEAPSYDHPFDYRKIIFRDLLWLLNTRRRCRTDSETALTVLDYGLPDIGDDRLEEEVKRTIEVFEPRLKNVSIKTVDLTTTSPQHSLRDAPGDRSNASANPFFGFGRSGDATGRNIASKKFRKGIVIEAELHGFEEGEIVSFGVIRDEDGLFHA